MSPHAFPIGMLSGAANRRAGAPLMDPRTQPVPSMSVWADGSANTANTASGAASIVVDAVARSVSIPVRRLAGPELIAARDTAGRGSTRGAIAR